MSATRERTGRAGPSAFTLIEMLIVMGIITLLAGLVIGVGVSLRAKAARDNTYMLVRKVNAALEQYEDTFTKWPDIIGTDPSAAPPLGTNYVLLANLLLSLDAVEPGEIENGLVVDAWGQPIRVVRDGHHRPGLDIWSIGPDGIGQYDPVNLVDYGDDVVNWRRR